MQTIMTKVFNAVGVSEQGIARIEDGADVARKAKMVKVLQNLLTVTQSLAVLANQQRATTQGAAARAGTDAALRETTRRAAEYKAEQEMIAQMRADTGAEIEPTLALQPAWTGHEQASRTVQDAARAGHESVYMPAADNEAAIRAELRAGFGGEGVVDLPTQHLPYGTRTYLQE
jgi:hypothetical protein